MPSGGIGSAGAAARATGTKAPMAALSRPFIWSRRVIVEASGNAGMLILLRSLVEGGRLLELRVGDEVVFDPQVRFGLLKILLDRHTRSSRLLYIELVLRRRPVKLPLLRIVIQVSAQHHPPGRREFQDEHLVPGCMSRRGFENHLSVS